MLHSSEKEVISQVVERLAELIRRPAEEVMLRPVVDNLEFDAMARVGPFTFVIEWRNTSSLDSIVSGIKHFQQGVILERVPLLATRYMSESGRERCREAGIHWLDLSGNASIHSDGVTIGIEGRPNAFPKRGRPANAFAPKSARIARWLLTHPDESFTQREIAHATAMDEGFTSRIVGRLVKMRLIQRDKQGRVRPVDAELLLDAWSEEYDFFKHDIIKGHVPARSGESLSDLVSGVLRGLGVDYAATGLAAAWIVSRFAGFRIATFYVRDNVRLALKKQLAFREEERGANLWLVTPNDPGVFQGGKLYGDLFCVHPIQVWLDLLAHPERAKEAAEQLRSELNLGRKVARAR